EVEPYVLARLGARTFPGGASLGLLLGHRCVKARLIDPHFLLDQRLLGKVEREAIGVVELERDFAGQRAIPRQLSRGLVEQLQAVRQRLAEARFLLLKRGLDQRLRAYELR